MPRTYKPGYQCGNFHFSCRSRIFRPIGMRLHAALASARRYRAAYPQRHGADRWPLRNSGGNWLFAHDEKKRRRPDKPGGAKAMTSKISCVGGCGRSTQSAALPGTPAAKRQCFYSSLPAVAAGQAGTRHPGAAETLCHAPIRPPSRFDSALLSSRRYCSQPDAGTTSPARSCSSPRRTHSCPAGSSASSMYTPCVIVT